MEKHPLEIVDKIGNFLTSDGFIMTSKYSDLSWSNFTKYYFYYYGIVEQFEIKFEDIENPLTIESLSAEKINKHLKNRYKENEKSEKKRFIRI